MKKELVLAVSLLSTPAWAQAPQAAPGWNSDVQARAPKPGTVTSPNPGNAAIAKIEAAGKTPNPGPRTTAPLSEPGGPGTAENNSGGR